MIHKLSLGVLCAVSFTFFSCNRTEEKKSDNSFPQTNSPSASAQKPPSRELLLLEKKFEQDTLNYEVRATLATNYYISGALDKAAYHFLKVYEHDNKNLIALSNLGNIYYDARLDDNAIEFYEKALEIDPQNINMRCDLATCYSNINKLKKAIQILKENIEMDKNHAQSHYNLSVILQRKGDMKEAEEEMKIYKSIKSGAN